MGMFSGCYLVLCGNEIAQPPLSSPSDSGGPLTITGTRTTRLPGDTNQLAARKRRLPGNRKYCKWNEWREIGRGLTVRQFNPAKRVKSVSRRPFFGLCSCYLAGMLNVWTRWNIQHKEKSCCEPWHLIKKDIRGEGEKNLKNKQKQKSLRYVI